MRRKEEKVSEDSGETLFYYWKRFGHISIRKRKSKKLPGQKTPSWSNGKSKKPWYLRDDKRK